MIVEDCKMGNGTNTPYDCCECTAEDYMQGYIQGSTDQRKIDIEKACDYFMEFNVDAPIKVDIDSWRQFITRILEE